MQNVITTKTNP